MRLEITRRADLAVAALLALAARPERVKATALADAIGTTAGFVPQVVAPLVRAGWVRSEPGPTGGYRLVADLRDVSVLAVIEAVDGPTDDGRCVVEDRACSAAAPCTLHGAWSDARARLCAGLAAIPVASAARAPRPAP